MGGLGNPAVMHSGGFRQSRSHAQLAFQRDSFKTLFAPLECRNLKYLSLTVCWLLDVKCAISRVGYTAGQNAVLTYKEHNQRERSWGGGETDRDRETERAHVVDITSQQHCCYEHFYQTMHLSTISLQIFPNSRNSMLLVSRKR